METSEHLLFGLEVSVGVNEHLLAFLKFIFVFKHLKFDSVVIQIVNRDNKKIVLILVLFLILNFDFLFSELA